MANCMFLFIIIMSLIATPITIRLDTLSGCLLRLRRPFLLGLCLVSFTTLRVVAVGVPPDLASQVDALFEDSVHSNTPGAAVFIARDGKILLEKGYGLAQVETRTPIKI